MSERVTVNSRER